MLHNENPSLGGAGAGADNSANYPGGGSALMVPRTRPAVKPPPTVELLRRQAAATTLRAEANAAWHLERAARYLAWVDSPWAAAQYRRHAQAADFQERIAARQQALLAALGEIRP